MVALLLLLGTPFASASRTFAVIGKTSAEGTDVFELPSLTKIGTTDALGSFSEAIVQIPGTCSFAAGSDTCCDGPTDPADTMLGYTQSCAADCSVRTADILLTADGGMEATATGAANSLGEGPDALEYDPESGKLLVANMGGNPVPIGPYEPGGNVAFLALDSDNAASLASPAVASPVITYQSHGHGIRHWGCGKALMVDCGSFSFASITSVVGESAVRIVDVETGEVEASVIMPYRTRALTLHPTLPVMYALYEMVGLIGVWTLPKCDAWTAGFQSKEIARVPTAPPGHPGISSPSRIIVSPGGEYAYSCSRYAFPMDVVPDGDLGSFAVSPSGNLTAVSWAKSSGNNPRECALSPDGATFIETDFDLGTLSVYAVGAGGQLTRTKTVDGIAAPNSLLIWSPDDQCFAAGSKLQAPPASMGLGPRVTVAALAVTGLVALVALVLRNTKDGEKKTKFLGLF